MSNFVQVFGVDVWIKFRFVEFGADGSIWEKQTDFDLFLGKYNFLGSIFQISLNTLQNLLLYSLYYFIK